MSEPFFDVTEAEDLYDPYGEGAEDYYDEGAEDYYDEGAEDYYDEGAEDYYDEGAGEGFYAEYDDEDFYDESEAAERYRGRRRSPRYRGRGRRPPSRGRRLPSRYAGRGRRPPSRSRPRPGRTTKPRRRPAAAPARPRPAPATPATRASTREVRKGFERAKTAIENVELDSQVQADRTSRALSAQARRIDGNAYAVAASKAVDGLQEQFPVLKNNNIVKAALPLAPLLFLRPRRKRPGLEGALMDPRVWGSAVALGAVAFNELQPGRGQVETIEFPDGDLQLSVNASKAVRVVAKDARGKVLTGKTFLFETSDGSIVGIENGVLTAKKPGTVTIKATDSETGKSKSITVTVTAPNGGGGASGDASGGSSGGPATGSIASIELPDGDFTIANGAFRPLRVVAKDAAGNVLPWQNLTFGISKPGIATIANGVLTAVAAGEIEIRVTDLATATTNTFKVKVE